MNKSYLIIILLALAGRISFSQGTAEDFYQKTFPLGIQFGGNVLHFSNAGDATRYYNLKDNVGFSFGLSYDIWQYRDLNITSSFIIRNAQSTEEVNIPDREIIGSGEHYLFIQGPYWTYHLNLGAEYTIPFYNLEAFYVHAGYELQYYAFTSGAPQTRNALSINDMPIIVDAYQETQQSITSGINLGIGYKIKDEAGSQFTIDLRRHFHFTPIEYSQILITNLEQSPDLRSYHEFTGNYTSLTVRWNPPLRWFKKEKK